MRNKIIIDKMIKYINSIINYTQGVSYEEFRKNSMMIEACVFNLQQIGELCKLVRVTMEKQYPGVPWAQIYGLRNRLVHDYDGVNLELIWQIITEDLEDLRAQLESIKTNM